MHLSMIYPLANATYNRLIESGHNDYTIAALSDSALINETRYTLTSCDCQQLNGIGSSLKKAAKKTGGKLFKAAKSVVEKTVDVHKSAIKAVVKVNKEVLSKANDVRKKVQDIEHGVRSELSRKLLPDSIADKAREFEQRHRPALKQAAVAAVMAVAAAVSGGAALAFQPLMLTALKATARSIVLDKITREYMEARQKKVNQKQLEELAKQDAVLRNRIETESKILEQKMLAADNGVVLLNSLPVESRKLLVQGYETHGPAYLESPEALELMRPAINKQSEDFIAAASQNPAAIGGAGISSNKMLDNDIKQSGNVRKLLVPIALGASLLIV